MGDLKSEPAVGIKMEKDGFVFSGTAFLLIIPAVLLAASFANMMKTGNIGTATAIQSDAIFYAYQNIQSNFERASCSYYQINGQSLAYIKSNLTSYWAPWIESNYSVELQVNVSIAENLINVTYLNSTQSIRVGSGLNSTGTIPMNISRTGFVHSFGLRPLEVFTTCSDDATAGTEEVTAPSSTLFLHKSGTTYYMDETDPTGATTKTSICTNQSLSWVQDPAFTQNFNITGDINVILYIKPTASASIYPSVTVNLKYGSTTLGSEVGRYVNSTDWEYFTISPSLPKVIPASTPVNLTVSVTSNSSNPCIEVWYDSADYNSAVVIEGNSTTSTLDTTAPVISNVQSSSVGPTNATITWTTDEQANSLVVYGTSAPPSSTSSNASYVTSHSITLTGLTPSTTYYFYVNSTDQSGNEAMDDNGGSYYTFSTSAVTWNDLLYALCPCTGPDAGTITNTTLQSVDTEIVAISNGDIDTVSFTDPTQNVSEVLSAVLYWADRRGGAGSNPERNLSVGNGTVWNWATYQATLTSSSYPSGPSYYNLNLTSYFLGVSPDNTDLQNIQLRYAQVSGSRNIDWTMAFINVTYTYT